MKFAYNFFLFCSICSAMLPSLLAHQGRKPSTSHSSFSSADSSSVLNFAQNQVASEHDEDTSFDQNILEEGHDAPLDLSIRNTDQSEMLQALPSTSTSYHEPPGNDYDYSRNQKSPYDAGSINYNEKATTSTIVPLVDQPIPVFDSFPDRDPLEYKFYKHRFLTRKRQGNPEIQHKDVQVPLKITETATDEPAETLEPIHSEPLDAQFEKKLREQKICQQQIEEMKRKKHSCLECNYGEYSLFGLDEHIKRIHSSNFYHQFVCEACGVSFKYSKSMKLHFLTKHNVNRDKYKCQKCLSIFQSTKALHHHEKTCMAERNYFCELCQKNFFGSTKFARHQKKYHGFSAADIQKNTASSATKFFCPFCYISYVFATTLNRHIKNKHPEKVLKCDICDETYGLKHLLAQHMIRHVPTSENQYLCVKCRNYFCNRDSLSSHIHKKHREPREYYQIWQIEASLNTDD